MTDQEKDQWIVDQYNRNRPPEDHITCPEDMPTGLQRTTYLPFIKGGGEPKQKDKK